MTSEMAKNKSQNKAWGGMYERVRDREYLIERRALLGLIGWEEVAHIDRLENETTLFVTTTEKPQKVLINGVEYISVQCPPLKETRA